MAVIAVAAAPAGAAEVSRSREQFVQAGFFSTDPSGCVTTNVFLFGVLSSTRSTGAPPTSGTFAFVDVSVFDACTSSSTSLRGSSTDLTLAMDGGLRRAALTGVIDLCDDANACRQFNIDIAWTALEERLRSFSWTRSSCGQGCRFFFKGQFLQQSAEATGVISDGATNLTPAPASFAALGSQTFSQNMK